MVVPNFRHLHTYNRIIRYPFMIHCHFTVLDSKISIPYLLVEIWTHWCNFIHFCVRWSVVISATFHCNIIVQSPSTQCVFFHLFCVSTLKWTTIRLFIWALSSFSLYSTLVVLPVVCVIVLCIWLCGSCWLSHFQPKNAKPATNFRWSLSLSCRYLPTKILRQPLMTSKL